MGLVEDALRDALAAQVAAPPAVHDPATRAIARARKLRQRRATFGAAAAVMSLALISAGYAVINPFGPTNAPAGVATGAEPGVWSAPLPVDVISANQIVLASGATIDLSDLPPVRDAWRVAGGWLVRTEDQGRSAVYSVAQIGTRIKLAEGEQVAVGRYGPAGPPMVAWGGDGTVSVAAFNDERLDPPITTTGVGDLGPREIVGGGVLLGERLPNGRDSYDMWFPARGPYVAGQRFTGRVIGVGSDHRRLFAIVGKGRDCLAMIEPADFTVEESQCDLDLAVNNQVFTSPDGRWLVALSKLGVDLYDLTAVWDTAIPFTNWNVTASGLAWMKDGSFIVIDQNRVIRLRPDQPQREEVAQVDVPKGRVLSGIVDLRN